jgi:hypothetical protein
VQGCIAVLIDWTVDDFHAPVFGFRVSRLLRFQGQHLVDEIGRLLKEDAIFHV